MKQLYFFLIVMSFSIGTIQAQKIAQEDYQRAVSFMRANFNNKSVFNLNTEVNWFKDTSGIWFVDHSKLGKSYKSISFSDYKVGVLFDHDKLAAVLSTVLEKELKGNELALSNIERTDNEHLTITVDNKTYTLDLKSYALIAVEDKKEEANNPFEITSPDGKWMAYTKDYNLFVKSTENDQEHQLSFDGQKDYEYATYYGWNDIMEGENGERQKHFYVNWSEDSNWISTALADFKTAEKMYLLDYSIDSLYKPKLLSYYRGSPGDTTMVKMAPVFFNIRTKSEVKTKLPTGTHINSVTGNWAKTSGVFYARYPERGYLKNYVKRIDLNFNTEETLIEETSNTGIDNFEFVVVDDKQKLIFLSERTGWRQLHIVDLKTNKTSLLTSDGYYINDIEYIDEENGIIYFLASGKEANNPYHQQLYKVDFIGNETLLTPENTHHNIQFSEDGTHFVDNYSTIEIPTKTVLREATSGSVMTTLTHANVDNAVAKGWKAPETFELTAKDGKTTIYGALWKPTNFDASKSYPIIDHSYTGPHTQVFPKTFSAGFWNQSLAELGFIVMMVDGLGTSGRSKEFHDHSYKNMKNNLEDHVLAIQFLGDRHSWINTDKVGIFGHSAGGYDTGRAMLGFPDVYKVGVASSADHDFRMEKAWWPEMYQGWPVDSTYQNASNITNAKHLKGKLLLVHGGLDDNVNPSATFKLAEALVKADKEFDLLILPSQRHGYQGEHRKYFIKKRWNYFIKHLLEVEPIWNFKWE